MEVGYLREVIVKRIMVIEFGVNDGGGSGISRCGIEVKTNTTQLSNMIIARFGEDKWSEKVRCSSKIKLMMRAGWVV